MTSTRRAPRHLIVDTDTSDLNDDAFALHYLLASGRVPDLITTVFGNSTAHSSASAALALTRAYGVDVVVRAGAERPLRWDGSVRRDLRAVVGALPADTYVASLRADDDSFWEYAVDDGLAAAELAAALARSPGCDVLALGPTTNVARAVRMLDSSVLSRHRLWVSGGATTRGNVTEAAEFNAFADPHALRECLSAGWEEVTMVPLEVTGAPRLDITRVERIRLARTPFGRALDELERVSPRGDGRDREPVWDVVVAVLLTEEAVPHSSAGGNLTVFTDIARRGLTTLSGGDAAHRVVTAVDPDAVLQRFEDAVTSQGRPS